MSCCVPAPSIIVVLSLSIITRLAVPSIPKTIFSRRIPVSSEMTCPFVSIPMSPNISFLRSPNPGALTAAILRPPRSLLTTNVDKASPSTSSAIIKSGRESSETFSRIGTKSCTALILPVLIRMKGSSSSTTWLSTSVTKCGDKKPLSNCIPSTISIVVEELFPSSTVMTPSLPILSIASAIVVPISLLLAASLAEIEATWTVWS